MLDLEQGNKAFKEGRFEEAVQHYSAAHQHEPEMAHYQLNLAAAHLKLSEFVTRFSWLHDGYLRAIQQLGGRRGCLHKVPTPSEEPKGVLAPM